MTVNEYVNLDVHPSVVFKLGGDLISDEVQALIELVKNCYDADATYARVTVDTTKHTRALTLRSPTGAPVDYLNRDEEIVASATLLADAESTEMLTGMLTVEDNGVGMTPDIIKAGWLIISNSHKRTMKRAGRTTGKRRTPLGDKGLGRLGAQRLGDELEIITRPKGSSVQYRVRIPWRVFTVASRLGQVSFPMAEEPPTMKTGTRLTVYGLSDVSLWHDRRQDLTRALSTLVSPFPGHTDLALTVRIDGMNLELVRLTERLRDTAEVRYKIAYRSATLTAEGKADIEYWRPAPDRPQDEHHDFKRLVERDGGEGFYNWFVDKNRQFAELWELKRRVEGNRALFVFAMSRGLPDLDGAACLNDSIADPGPFTAEIDAFSLDRATLSVFDSVSTYRDYFRAIAGVRLYRNGFGIRMQEDWLGLGKRWGSGASYYNLKPTNVLGFVDLSAKDNGQLEEMTDREGLRSSPYLTNFMLLMEQWRQFTERVQTRLRREYNKYRSETAAQSGGLERDSATTPEAVARELHRRSRSRQDEARRQKTTLREANNVLADLTEATQGFAGAESDGEASPAARRRLLQVESSIGELSRVVAELSARQTRQDQAGAQEVELLSALQQQLELVREQLAMSYEAVALGLTAEALSHEVHQIADRLASRTSQVRRTLVADNRLTPVLSNYLEYVRSQATSLNRQMAHLNPALRFARERRSSISVLAFLGDVAGYFNQRWRAADGLRIVAVIDPESQDFTVSMNAGRLTQVVDNLLLNSEYWLRAQAKQDAPHKRRRAPTMTDDDLPMPIEGDGQVLLLCSPRRIRISDNGPGVAPAFEGTLLEPFITAKRDGRGLGLYISQQLLESEGARLTLDKDRNPFGRRYSFTIDLANVPA